jgi:hypothetical protein
MNETFTDVFTTNENTTDGEILDSIYRLALNNRLTDRTKVHHITLLLEYAREEN